MLFSFSPLKNKQLNSLPTKIIQDIMNCIKPAVICEIQILSLPFELCGKNSVIEINVQSLFDTLP